MGVLFKQGALLLPEGKVLENGWLLTADDKIAAYGTGTPPANLPADTEICDLQNGLLMPGLINAHTHAAMTIFRGLADDNELMDWLNNYIFPAESNLTADWVKWGTALACAEMIRSGTTCFADMYFFIDAAVTAAAAAGLRTVSGEVLTDFPSRSYGNLEQGFAHTRTFIEKWRNHPTVHPAVNAHAPYTCSPALLQKAHTIAAEYDVPLHVHVAETEFEVKTIIEKYGARPLEHLAHLGIADSRLMAAHMVWLDDAELDLAARNGVKVLHNPVSNLKLASGIARVPEMLQRGIAVGLGTDGDASNNNLDMFEEMKTAACVHKWAARSATAVSAEQAVQMATNAHAVGLNGLIGEIASGRAADLIVVDFSAAHLRPCYNRISQIVYAANGGDVRDNMVNGRWLMRNRKLCSIDEEEVFANIERIAGQVRKIILNKQ